MAALRNFTGILAMAALVVNSCWSDEVESSSPQEVFEQRIMPIFNSPQPSSCVQCHLAAVDLKDYILPSHEKTFVSLREQGLIDLANPERSKILTLIEMGEKDLDKGARLIHEKMRRAEYDAFAAWIKACCSDPKIRDLPATATSELAKPEQPDEVIRHARKSRVIDSFTRNVWSQRMRCFPCHTPHELDESNPKLLPAIKKHKEFLAQRGGEFAERMHLFRETPELTVQAMIERSRNTHAGELPLINLAQPRKSLLVLKPTSKVPAKNADGEFEPPRYTEPVSHLGGLKMHVDDQSYKAFIAWIQDYAAIVGDQYTSVADLPLDNWYASKHVIILREVPKQWPAAARIQLFVHAQKGDSNSWNSDPVAFTQGSVTPIRNVAGSLFVFGPPGRTKADAPDAENARLPPGKYLLKAFVDSGNRLAEDPTVMLGDDDYYGQAVIDARWGEGFPEAVKVSGSILEARTDRP